jgi:phospholipid/cholesterol/gamma-HCH transport system substrate-binding protein
MQVKTDFPISKSSKATIWTWIYWGRQIAIEPNFQDKKFRRRTVTHNVRMGLTESIGNKLGPIQVKLEKNND